MYVKPFCRFVPVLLGAALSADAAPGQGSVDIEPVLQSLDIFLDRQLDRFLPLPEDYPKAYQDAQLIQTYDHRQRAVGGNRERSICSKRGSHNTSARARKPTHQIVESGHSKTYLDWNRWSGNLHSFK